MSLVKSLATTTLDSISSELGLVEQGSAASPYKTLRSPMSPDPVGQVRLFHGRGGEAMVYIGLTVPMIQLDSHMVFCFTAPDSALPHFTVDAVNAGAHYAFHLDLIPRVDLAVNLSYMRELYEGLTPQFESARQIPGLTAAHLSPMQLALMSPWMLAHRASSEAMDAIGAVVSEYRGHWLGLMKKALPRSYATPQELKKRDEAHRQLLFSPEVDPVWKQVERLIGAETAAELRQLLIKPQGQS